MLLITLPELRTKSSETEEEELCYTELQPVSEYLGSLISSSTDPCLGENPDEMCAEYVISTEDGLSPEDFTDGCPTVYTLPESPQSLSEVSDNYSFTEQDLLPIRLYEDSIVSDDEDDDASVMLDLMDLSFLDENPSSVEDEVGYGPCFTDFIDACPTVIVTAARGCTPDLRRFNPSPSPPTPIPFPCPSPPTLPPTSPTATQAVPSVPSPPSPLTLVPNHAFDTPLSPSSSSSSSSFPPSSPTTLTLHYYDPCPTAVATTTTPSDINDVITVWESTTLETLTIPTAKANTTTTNNNNDDDDNNNKSQDPQPTAYSSLSPQFAGSHNSNNNDNNRNNNKGCLRPVAVKASNGSNHYGWRIVQQQYHYYYPQQQQQQQQQQQRQRRRKRGQTFQTNVDDEREDDEEDREMEEETEVKGEVEMDFDTFDHSDDDENDEERDFKPYCGSRRGAKKNLLWKFLLWSLDNHSDVVSWTDIHNGEFKFLDTDRISSLWGQRKKKQTMTFEKLSRAIRHYYKRGLMERLPHTRLVYKFNWDKVPKRYRKV